MDQERIKEELDYRKEQLSYYGSKVKDALDDLPRAARYGVYALAGILVLLLLKSCMGGGGASTPQKTMPQNAVMPRVTLMTKLDAEQKLSNLGVNNLQENPVKELSGSNPNDPDIILDQSPKEGAKITTDTKVLLSYGSKSLYEKSKVNVTMPDVVGMTLPKATALLNTKGFSNVTLPIRANPTIKDDMLVIATMSPESGTPGTLNTPIKLTTEPGIDIDDLKAKLSSAYIPYNTFANIERTSQRNLKITLAQKNSSIKTKKDADNYARLQKIGIEKVLGEPVDDITVVMPGSKIIGDSGNVDMRATTSGITVSMAEEKCLDSSGSTFSNITANWDKDTLMKKVDATSITLMARVSAQGSDESTQQLVLTCTASGDPGNIQISNYSLQ